MILIDEFIEIFLGIIRASWPFVETCLKSDKTGSFKEDWLQANWELIVENTLGCAQDAALEVYGDGADANGQSSRVLFPSRCATHRVCCVSSGNSPIWDYLNNQEMTLENKTVIFDRFVSIGNEGWYYESNPFSHVLVKIDNNESVFKESDVKYIIRPIIS